MLFDHLAVEDGLSQSNVTAILQDHSGFMWFATESGLNRYDGYRFETYRRDRSGEGGLRSDFISDLALDKRGNLWMATDGGGIAKRDAATHELTVYRQGETDRGLSSDQVQAIVADPRGWVWIGTRHHGVNRLDIRSGEIRHYRRAPDNAASLSSDDIMGIALDRSGVLWVATLEGLNSIDPATDSVQRFLHDPGDPATLGSNRLHSVYVDRSDAVWVGTLSAGLYLLKSDSRRFLRFAHDRADWRSLSNNRVQAILEDSAGRFWVGTAQGLNLLDRESGTFVRFHHDRTDLSSLSSDNIVSLFEDTGGVLWVGTKTGGVNKWNPRSWSLGHVRPRAGGPAGLSSGHITSFAETVDGTLLVGTFGGGLNLIDPGTMTIRHLRHDPDDQNSLSDDRVMSLLASREGPVVLGTMGGGLTVWNRDQGRFAVYRHDPGDRRSLAADGIMSLLQDSRGRIWVGTFGGGLQRFRLENGSFESAAVFGNAGARVTAITEDTDGSLWVGTDGDGLLRYDPDTASVQRAVHDESDPGSLSANTVYALHVDSSGDVWVGTRGGLDRAFRDAGSGGSLRFESITEQADFSNDTIYGIQSDAGGHLWVSTNFGLTRYHKQTGETRHFHRSHGLQGEEFNFGAHFAGADGKLYFGGADGFNAFFPDEVAVNQHAPPVRLTMLEKLNKPVVSKTPYERLSRVELGYLDDVVTFEFSALDYASPDQNRYAYMLEGFDKEWVFADNERRITYTNLDQGRYTLRVKAANSDDVWSGDPAEIALLVAPPPWQSWWAYVSYLLAGIATVWWFLRSQARKLEREAEYSRRLEFEVRQQTSELAEKNKELRLANSKLHEASHTDTLTGLRNRRYLFDEIVKEIHLLDRERTAPRRGRRKSGNDELVFMMVDLDNFKPINDSVGHEAGDMMLLHVKDVLLGACRSSDIIVRWGGDEFLIVARKTGRDAASVLAERIRSSLAEKLCDIGSGQVARTTCSIGFAPYPFIKESPSLLSWEQVLGIADVAMYRAKSVRDSWCGISGNEWSGSADRLVHAIKSDVSRLAEEGVVRMLDPALSRGELSA